MPVALGLAFSKNRYSINCQLKTLLLKYKLQ